MGAKNSKPKQQQQQQQQQQQHQEQQQGPSVLNQLLGKLQQLADNTLTATGPVPNDVLTLVDQALQVLQGRAAHCRAPDAAQKAVEAAQPHVDTLATVAEAVEGALWDVSDKSACGLSFMVLPTCTAAFSFTVIL
jgi:chromosome condensin MukBEF ATPase and DNA-binding subunit MukB